MMDQRSEKIKMMSTTNLATDLDLKTTRLFELLQELNLLTRVNDRWELTANGKAAGGAYRESKRIGRYVVWPETIKDRLTAPPEKERKYSTATTIGKEFGIPAYRMNSIFSELGWIQKDKTKGWRITELGKQLGGIESEHTRSGVPFVRWPDALIQNEILKSSIDETKGEASIAPGMPDNDQNDFRTKFVAEYRTKDGHFVRSKAELIIDNYLYDYQIIHAYERKIPIQENIYCDFYLPEAKVYIEYWGSEEAKYLERKTQKQEIYKKHHLNLIELSDNDISNLDDILPARLLKFGIDVES